MKGNKKQLSGELKNTIIGCLFGGLVLHPIVMIVGYVNNNYQKIDMSALFNSALSTLSWQMLPMEIIYIVLCGLAGYIYAKKQSMIVMLIQELKECNERLDQQVKERTKELSFTQIISIEVLGSLAEYHDDDTGEHIQRIREYTRVIISGLEEIGHYLDYVSRPNYAEDLSIASLLHDIGKVGIPKDILTKPGKLTNEEFEVIKAHTTIAANILETANQTFVTCSKRDSYLALARDIALYHHEKWNGKGYPSGLLGEHIPLSARIVALVDVYDALISERPYKKPWSHKDVVEEIKKSSGKHFDPKIVEAFLLNERRFREIAQSYD